MSKIVFYLETQAQVTGRQTMFLDMAGYLADHTKNEVYYVNNLFEQDLNNNISAKLNVIDVSNCDFSMFENSVFIVPINYLFFLLTRIKNLNKCKLLLYVYDNSAMARFFSQYKGSCSKADLLSRLKASKCCFFSDRKVYYETCLKYGFFEEQYLPLTHRYRQPVSTGYTDIVEPDCINIAYVGNEGVADLNSINNIATHLMASDFKNKRIKFHLIGSSSILYKLDLTKYTPYITFYCPGNLSYEDSVLYLKNNVDIAVASDEKAISIASVKMPVVIPINTGKKQTDNKYVFFNDAQGYIYRWDRELLLFSGDKYISLNYVLYKVYKELNKIDLSKKIYKAYLKNNCYEQLSEILIDLIKRSTLDVKSCVKYKFVSDQLKKFDEFKTNNPDLAYYDFLYKRRPEDKKTPFKSRLKSVIKKNIPAEVLNHKFFAVQKQYKKKKKFIYQKYNSEAKIKVGFIVVFNSVFPTRPVFEKMLGDKVFDPYIIVAPNVSRSYKYQMNLYNEAFNNLSAQYGDRVINGYDIASDEYLELKDEYGILFFCNPYKHLVHPFHEIEYFLDKNVLPIYSSYGFAALKFWDEVIATDFYNYLWKACVETESNLEYLKKTEKIKGKNGIVTGYIKMDKLALAKPLLRDRKQILICPHHTVWGWKTLNISNFLSYYNLFLRLPELYPDIDFIFRPHPLLFENLKAHRIWTQKQIDEYLNKISEIPNMVYDKSGDYMQQFVDSDAMIHDCGSFIGEYLYTGNPCCYMMKSEEQTMSGLVPLGQECIKRYYHAFNESDILKFIEDVVINGMDPKKSERENFVETQLKVNYPNAAEYVIEMLKSELRIK